MRTKTFLLGTFCCLAAISCTKEMANTETAPLENRSPSVSSIMSFSSAEQLQRFMDDFSQGKVSIETNTRSESGDFISLWDYNKSKDLSELSLEDISAAEADGLEYEPEDEIIADPFFTKILNDKRELKVDGKTYRYVNNGLIAYDNTVDPSSIDLICTDDFSNLEEGDSYAINEHIMFTKIDYDNPIDNELSYSNNMGSGTGISQNGLTLSDGIYIPNDRIRRVDYERNGGDASGFQKFASGIFGKSVVATNYFNKTHRMKLRTFSENYVLWKSVGMTVRMQHKRAGIWWRRKANEFRYGWTGVECRYHLTLTDAYRRYAPEKGRFWGLNLDKFGNIIFFPVDNSFFNNHSTSIYQTYLNALEKGKKMWNQRRLAEFPETKSWAESVYSVTPKERLILIYPPFEERDTNDGREKVNWKFGGAPMVPDFQYDFDESITEWFKQVDVSRVEIFGAVKYGDEWRACIIADK